MLSLGASLLVEKAAADSFTDTLDDPWHFSITLVMMLMYSTLRDKFQVNGVEKVPGVAQVWEVVIASLFSMWLTVPATRISAARKVLPTDHLKSLEEIKKRLSAADSSRRWVDLLTFIPAIFHDKCPVKTTRLETLPSLETLVTVRNHFADWVATEAESGYTFRDHQVKLWGIRASRLAKEPDSERTDSSSEQAGLEDTAPAGGQGEEDAAPAPPPDPAPDAADSTPKTTKRPAGVDPGATVTVRKPTYDVGQSSPFKPGVTPAPPAPPHNPVPADGAGPADDKWSELQRVLDEDIVVLDGRKWIPAEKVAAVTGKERSENKVCYAKPHVRCCVM